MKKYIDISAESFLNEDEVKLRFGARIINRLDALTDGDLASVGVEVIDYTPQPPPDVLPWQTRRQGELDKTTKGEWKETWITDNIDLNTFKESLRVQLNKERDLMEKNLSLVLEVDGIPWRFGDKDLQVLEQNLLMYTLGAALPEYWRDYDNKDHPCTIELLLSITSKYQSYKGALYTKSWEMKDYLRSEACDSYEKAEDVVWSNYLPTEFATPALRCLG